MHGSIMLFLFLGPFAFGLANYFVPLQIGARDMAFPRLNALELLVLPVRRPDDARRLPHRRAARPTSAGPPTRRCRRRSARPGVGRDLWIIGVAAHRPVGRPHRGQHRHHGDHDARARHDDVPHADLHLEHARHERARADRVPGADRGAARCSSPTATSAPTSSTRAGGGAADPVAAPVLVLRPPRGVHPRPAVLRRGHRGARRCSRAGRCSATPGLVFATLAIASLSVGVWAHHMFATGAVPSPFFSGLSMLIAVPTGVKFFNWIGTMWGGQITLRHADAVRASGSCVTFLLGGLTGVLLASAPIDFHVHRLVLRRRPHALRAVRRLGVRALRRHLLLVPEGHRPAARRAARARSTSG